MKAEPPDFSVRRAQRDILAEHFRAHEWADVDDETLDKLVGANYRSRISECRNELGMDIVNVPQFFVNADGKRQRGLGAYRYRPYVPLGRAAHEHVDQKSLW